MAKQAQTHAKRARELELRERRERKRAKKAEAAASRAAGGDTPTRQDDTSGSPDARAQDKAAATFAPEPTT
jgi:hypothetical protein